MVTNLCFGLTCLLIPVLIELFNLQAGLHISYTGHALIEVLILCGAYWLFIQILRLDEWLYLRNLIQPTSFSQQERSNARRNAHVRRIVPVERSQTRQIKATAFHWPRIPIENFLKNHRTVKP